MWDDLSMADRAKYIQLGVLNGIYNVGNIRETYNKYEQGGDKSRPKAYARRAGEIPEEYRDPEVDYTKYASQGIYVDEAGIPISKETLNNYDTSSLTWWKPSLKTTGQTQLDISDTRAVEKKNADEYASQFSAPALIGALGSGMNALSPSQQFGAIVDWAQGEKGYWEGIGGTNSGFFTDKYAEEHPIISTLGNIGIDAALGLTGLDALELMSRTSKHYNNSLSLLEGLKSILKSKSYKELERSLNTKSKDFYQENIVPKLEAAGIDKADIPTLYHSNIQGGFSNLPIKVKRNYNPFSRTAGYHDADGTNIVHPVRDEVATAIHEAVSHGTDQLLPKEVEQFYKDTLLRLSKKKFINRDSREWYEFRATKTELEHLLKEKGIDINDISDKELKRLLKRTNGYGEDYARQIKGPSETLSEDWSNIFAYPDIVIKPDKLGKFNTPYRRSKNEFLDRLRYSIKYVPAVGITLNELSNSSTDD